MIYECDIESGFASTRSPLSHLFVKLGVVCLCLLFVLGFCIEYYQEFVTIAALKANHPLTLECTITPPDEWAITRWLKTQTGLSDQHSKECQEQMRIHALLPIPNPLMVLFNLVWRVFLGDHASLELSRLMSQQSYIVQIALVVTIVLAAVFLIHSFFTHIPSNIARLLTPASHTQSLNDFHPSLLQLQSPSLQAITPYRPIKRTKQKNNIRLIEGV